MWTCVYIYIYTVYIPIYGVTTFKYVEGKPDHKAPEVVGNTSSICIFKCMYVWIDWIPYVEMARRPRKTFLEVVYNYNTSSYITKSVYLDVVTVYDNEFFYAWEIVLLQWDSGWIYSGIQLGFEWDYGQKGVLPGEVRFDCAGLVFLCILGCRLNGQMADETCFHNTTP